MPRSACARSPIRSFGLLVLAGLTTLALCLPATASDASAVGRTQAKTTSSVTSAATASGRVQAATGELPVGGVLGDYFATGLDDIMAIDPAGNLWMYYNDFSGDQNMFATSPTLIGGGWTGYTLAAVGRPYGDVLSGILAIDPAGRLWYYPNNGGNSLPGPGQLTFGAPSQVGTGWAGYTVVGLTNLYSTSTVYTGLLAVDRSGNLWYYPNAGGNGTSTFGARSLVGTGWNGYTADVADFNGDGRPDLLAVDSAGNLWFYPNAGGSGTATFGARAQVGSGWSGWQAIDVGCLVSGCGSVTSQSAFTDILGTDANGNLWYFPDTGSSAGPQFGTPIQVGTGFTGFRLN